MSYNLGALKRVFATLICSILMIMVAASSSLIAAEETEKEEKKRPNVFLSAYAGYHHFSSNRDLDSNWELGARIGVPLNEKWAIKGYFGGLKSEDDNKDEVNIFNYGVMADRTLVTALRPFRKLYATFGIGSQVIDTHLEDDTLVWGGFAGIGYRQTLTSRLQGFAEMIAGTVEGYNDGFDVIGLIGLTLLQSEQKPKPKPVVVAVEKPKPVPKPAPKPIVPTPAPIIVKVDTDNDGIFDQDDICPDTVAGFAVNSQGCIENIRLKIQFKTNSHAIRSGVVELKRFAEVMKRRPNTVIDIVGHTDNVGSEERNLTLSNNRALAVEWMLNVRYGIEKDRLTPIGKGESEPIATNDTPEGRQENRRVEVILREKDN